MPFMYSPPRDPLAVWNVPIADIVVVGSIGEALDSYTADVAAILANVPVRYKYGPAALANNTTFVPPAGTIVTTAFIDATITGADDWIYKDAAANTLIDSFVQANDNPKNTIIGVLVMEGNNGFKQATGGSLDITLEGWTMV